MNHANRYLNTDEVTRLSNILAPLCKSHAAETQDLRHGLELKKKQLQDEITQAKQELLALHVDALSMHGAFLPWLTNDIAFNPTLMTAASVSLAALARRLQSTCDMVTAHRTTISMIEARLELYSQRCACIGLANMVAATSAAASAAAAARQADDENDVDSRR